MIFISDSDPRSCSYQHKFLVQLTDQLVTQLRPATEAGADRQSNLLHINRAQADVRPFRTFKDDM